MRRAAYTLLLVASCQELPSQTANRISSIELDLLQPTNVGSPMAPVQVQSAAFNLTALDDHGAVWPRDVDVDVYVSFGGVKTGLVTGCGASADGKPIETIHLKAGTAINQTVALPQAFGATTIWVEEHTSAATGASPTIYFPNPLISDVQTPPDLTAPDATFCSSLSGKFITIDRATGSGKLVVTSVFSGAFAVTDTGGTIFNSMYVYSFGQPPSYIVPGKVINSFSGNVSKFVGFTELNFPLFDAADDTVPLAPVPSPVPLTEDLLTNRMNTTLLQWDASLVQVTGKICDPEDPNIQGAIAQWYNYDTFVLDNDGTCQSISNYAVQLEGKKLGNFDPVAQKGQTITAVGMLRNNSGQNPYLDVNGMTIPCDVVQQDCLQGVCVDNICKKGPFNFWTVNPRTPADIIVQ
jgi:hypothetical protein